MMVTIYLLTGNRDLVSGIEFRSLLRCDLCMGERDGQHYCLVTIVTEEESKPDVLHFYTNAVLS